MPKTKLLINRSQLENAVKKAERENSFTNLQSLYESVSNSEWGRQQKGLTPAVVRLRILEFKIKTETKAGKKTKGVFPGVRGKRQSRSQKFAASPDCKLSITKLKRTFTEHPELVKQIEKGSMKAAIKLNCIDCCGGSTSEANHCELYECPLWLFLPRKKYETA